MHTRCIVALLLAASASATSSNCPADASNHGSCHGDVPLGDVTSLVQRRHSNMNERKQEGHYPVQEKEGGLVQEDEGASAQRSAFWCTPVRTAERTQCKNNFKWKFIGGGNDLYQRCAEFCDHHSRHMHVHGKETYWYSAGYSGDCKCCDKDPLAHWSHHNWFDSWKCVGNPVACEMNEWSEWGSCSESCGNSGVIRSRSRTVRSYPKNGGAGCGAREESAECVDQKECPVHCELSEWTDWNACSVTCGQGERTRSRSVAVEEEHGGQKCDEETKASEACREPECPVHCQLGEWGDWSACSATCGQGVRHRSRRVVAEEEHGGRKCDEETKASERCKEPECPVDPVWEPQVVVCGQVKNGADNTLVDGVQVTIPEQRLEAVTRGGQFCFSGPEPGTVTMTATKEGWVTDEDEVTITTDMTTFDDIVMSEKLDKTEWRIMLKWHEQPKDLNSIAKFGDCQVDTNTTEAENCGNGMTGVVDHDNTDHTVDPAAETTTITVDPDKCGSNCMIYFRVQNYLADATRTPCADPVRCPDGFEYKSYSLIRTQAEVKVINGDKEVAQFEVKKANWTISKRHNGEGHGLIKDAFWYAFAIDAKSSKVVACEKPQIECV